MRWGTVRVTITVNGSRITRVSASYPTERPRSTRINEHAIPILRSEALSAQSSNIRSVSGATMTSSAYKSSLRSALARV